MFKLIAFLGIACAVVSAAPPKASLASSRIVGKFFVFSVIGNFNLQFVL